MPQPNKIPRPFADSGDKNSIPDSSGALGFASWQEGFPAITGTPFAQGGVAPKRADFNGIFNALSAATVWQQQGGVYAYDATTDYEVGNVIEYTDNLYKCSSANGPSSAVKPPTDATAWRRLLTDSDLSTAYTSANFSTISVPTGTNTNLGSYTFTKKGVYLLEVVADFESNSTGYRQVLLSQTATGSFVNRFCNNRAHAVSGEDTALQLVYLFSQGATTLTYYINVYQDSGSPLNCYGGIRVIRIGEP